MSGCTADIFMICACRVCLPRPLQRFYFQSDASLGWGSENEPQSEQPDIELHQGSNISQLCVQAGMHNGCVDVLEASTNGNWY